MMVFVVVEGPLSAIWFKASMVNDLKLAASFARKRL